MGEEIPGSYEELEEQLGCYLSIFKYSEELRKIMYTTNTMRA